MFVFQILTPLIDINVPGFGCWDTIYISQKIEQQKITFSYDLKIEDRPYSTVLIQLMFFNLYTFKRIKIEHLLAGFRRILLFTCFRNFVLHNFYEPILMLCLIPIQVLRTLTTKFKRTPLQTSQQNFSFLSEYATCTHKHRGFILILAYRQGINGVASILNVYFFRTLE